MLSGALGTAFGVSTLADVVKAKLDSRSKSITRQKATMRARHQAARRYGMRVLSRSRKLIATTLAQLPGEAIPMLGIPLLLAGTAYELKVACDNLDDLDRLYRELGLEEWIDGGVLESGC